MSDLPENPERDGSPAAGGFIPPSSTDTPQGGQVTPPPWQAPPPDGGAWQAPPPQAPPLAGPPGQAGGAWGFAPGAFTSQPYAGLGQNQYGGPPVKKTNVLAIVALVFALLGVIPFLGILAAITGAIMGFVARKMIRASNGVEVGEGFALAAIVVGLVLLGLQVSGIALLVGVVHHCAHSNCH
ncbi:MAG: DUF4190 domain-containing protein [Acidimicrobiales bacterium]